jgi:hypothetical protein
MPATIQLAALSLPKSMCISCLKRLPSSALLSVNTQNRTSMSDPLSVASGVAGLICLGGTVSKLFYSFFMSTIGAPSSARSLASALFSLNTSLGQVQEVLLNQEFVQQANDLDILALEQCLTRCAELFSGIEYTVKKSGLVEQGQGNAKNYGRV